ncbi:hypothetical protein P4O66_019378, partial [Electrophorus voltai]
MASTTLRLGLRCNTQGGSGAPSVQNLPPLSGGGVGYGTVYQVGAATRVCPTLDLSGISRSLLHKKGQLRGARYFMKLYLCSAYNLIWIKEGDEWKTAFSTSTGHYEYLVLLYGLATAPSIFQAYINEVLREFLGRSVTAYIDNILTYFFPERPVMVEVDASNVAVGCRLGDAQLASCVPSDLLDPPPSAATPLDLLDSLLAAAVPVNLRGVSVVMLVSQLVPLAIPPAYQWTWHSRVFSGLTQRHSCVLSGHTLWHPHGSSTLS